MMPRLIIMMLLANSRIRITVVKPPRATPESFCTREITPSTRETASITKPSTVTMCRGAEEKEAILVRAYFTRDLVDHLLSPAVRSCTQ